MLLTRTFQRLPPIWLIATVVLLSAVYLRWTPAVPDLAAQVARADVAKVSGATSWWTGWFGGVSLSTYSMLVPSWMAVLGVAPTGVVAVLIGSRATSQLVRNAPRPRLGAVAFATAQVADLVAGRITFAVGVAFAACALVALRERRWVLLAVLAAASFASSPLAAMFLGFGLAAVAIVDPSRRRWSCVIAAALVIGGATMDFLFPGTGTMPFHALDVVAPALGCIGVILACRQPIIRVGAGLLLIAIVGFFLDPGAVGQNITRLVWIAAVPVVLAYSSLPTKKLIAVALGVALWPAGDLAGQLSSSTSSSAAQSFYQPVANALRAQQRAAGASATGQRVEVVDTANHWGSAYLSSLSLARGWDRQVDRAVNPVFYDDGALTAASYHAWLDQLAVGWVAVPAAPLDYAAVQEAALVRGGLPYLRLTWSSHNWRLYRVQGSTALVKGAQVLSVTDGGVTMQTPAAGAVQVRIRWSAYLQVTDRWSGQPTPSCLTDVGGWVQIYLPRAQAVVLTSQFDPADRLRTPDTDCVADLQRPGT